MGAGGSAQSGGRSYRMDDDDEDDEEDDAASYTEDDAKMDDASTGPSASSKVAKEKKQSKQEEQQQQLERQQHEQYQSLFGFRRPKRQRTSTTFYTDENPSTHTYPTAKVKREEEAAARALAGVDFFTSPPSKSKTKSKSSSSSRSGKPDSAENDSHAQSQSKSHAESHAQLQAQSQAQSRRKSKSSTPKSGEASAAINSIPPAAKSQKRTSSTGSAKSKSASKSKSKSQASSSAATSSSSSSSSSSKRRNSASASASEALSENTTKHATTASTPSKQARGRPGRKRKTPLPTQEKGTADQWNVQHDASHTTTAKSAQSNSSPSPISAESRRRSKQKTTASSSSDSMSNSRHSGVRRASVGSTASSTTSENVYKRSYNKRTSRVSLSSLDDPRSPPSHVAEASPASANRPGRPKRVGRTPSKYRQDGGSSADGRPPMHAQSHSETPSHTPPNELNSRRYRRFSSPNDASTASKSLSKGGSTTSSKKTTAAARKARSKKAKAPARPTSSGTGISHSVRIHPILPSSMRHVHHSLGPTSTNNGIAGAGAGVAVGNSGARVNTSATANASGAIVADASANANAVIGTGAPAPNTALSLPQTTNRSTSSATMASLEQAYPIVFRNAVDHPKEVAEPRWGDVYEPPIYYNRDYEGDDNSLTDPSDEEDDDDDEEDDEEEERNMDVDSGDAMNAPRKPGFRNPSTMSSHRSSRTRRSLKTLDTELPPVKRSVSCLTMRAPNNDYLAVGDTAGFVTIYAMDPNIRPIQRLESVACSEDRSYAQQQNIRQQIKNKKKTRSRDDPHTTIQAMSMVGSRIVLATACELECINVRSATSLWVFPFDPARRQVVSLDMHPITYDVLVSCRMTKPTKGSQESSAAPMAGPISPMLVLKHAHGNIEICDANSPSLVKSPFCTAIWDRSVVSSSPSSSKGGAASVEDESTTQLLLCSPMADETNDWKLILLQGGSIDQWKVKTKTKIPSVASSSATGSSSSSSSSSTGASASSTTGATANTANTPTNNNGNDNTNTPGNASSSSAGAAQSSAMLTLRQSRKGKYTFAASARGIRLFLTETLVLLQVYGDQLALHGRSIVWRDVALMGKAPLQQHKQGDPSSRRFHTINKKDNSTMDCYDVLSMWENQPSNNANHATAATIENTSDTLANSTDNDSNSNNRGHASRDDKTAEDEDEDVLGQFIVGIPHPTKGPKELCEALHVWDTGRATSVPLLHLPLPQLSDGVRSLVASTSTSQITAQSGLGDRLILATQRGACHQWVPAMQSNFSGAMYSAGYQTLSDNVEYIEDEDEVDKSHFDYRMAVTSMSHGDANGHARKHAHAGQASRGLSGGLNADMEEAMRLSMLESVKSDQKNQVADEDDESAGQDMDVTVVDDDVKEMSFIPCRPEAFLRQQINRMDNGRNGGSGGRLNGKSGVNGSGKPHRSHFLTSMLDIMPHKDPVQEEREQEQKQSSTAETITLTTFTLVAADVKSNGGSSRSGGSNGHGSMSNASSKSTKGRRSRASNLKAIMKASVDPRLQAYMASSQQQWRDGSGCKFVFNADDEVSEAAITGKETPEIPPSDEVSGMGATAVPATAEGIVRTNVSTAIDQPSKESVRFVSDGSEANANDSEVIDATKPAPHAMQATAQSASLTPQPNQPLGIRTDLPVSSGPATTASNMDSYTKSSNSEETAIFALLGLSPCNVVGNNDSKTTTPRAAVSTEPKAVPEANAMGNGMVSVHGIPVPVAAKTITPKAKAAPTSAKKQTPVAPEETADSTSSDEAKIDRTCPACMGRMVIHSCGKRALPIDYDEVIRKERIRREKEEEERKRVQKEKRRLADARRREARKQKMREQEQRKRIQEENERIEKERRRRLDMASYEASSNYVDDRNRETPSYYASYETSAASGRGNHSYSEYVHDDHHSSPPPSEVSSATPLSGRSRNNTPPATFMATSGLTTTAMTGAARAMRDDPDAAYRNHSVARSRNGEQAAASREHHRSYITTPVAQTFVQNIGSPSHSHAGTQDQRAYSLLEHRQYHNAYTQAASSAPAPQEGRREVTPASWSKASITGTSDDYGRHGHVAGEPKQAPAPASVPASGASLYATAPSYASARGSPYSSLQQHQHQHAQRQTNETSRPAAKKRRSKPAGTLSSAEGLAALASLAGLPSSMKLPTEDEIAYNQQQASFETSSRTAAAMASIPSYEAIRTEQRGLGNNGFVQGCTTNHASSPSKHQNSGRGF